ncbi:MAG: hypothetical protein PWQ30_1579 [Euryarchaeota archaeon]|jgi:hypothetical protein|nr:hypothetical protein [Euryarchaeota archaeon]
MLMLASLAHRVSFSVQRGSTASREEREAAKCDLPRGGGSMSTVRCEGELLYPSTDLRVLRGFA